MTPPHKLPNLRLYGTQHDHEGKVKIKSAMVQWKLFQIQKLI
jgi:hypothetical protein